MKYAKVENVPTPPGQMIPLNAADFSIVLNGYLIEQFEDGHIRIDGKRAKSDLSLNDVFHFIKSCKIKEQSL